MTTKLLSSVTLGRQTLQNRVVMAPMTRCRATRNIPNALMATYYQQRASAGLLITEGTAPSPDGLGYARIPALYNAEHVAGWKLVTSAVHSAGGKIFAQLMHTGRVSHPSNMPKGTRVIAPSALAAPGEMYTDQAGPQPYPVPVVMDMNDIQRAIGEFATSATLAIEAGFDGVELHAANGYLIEQFLNTATNKRTDAYGMGSVESRIRFAVEVAKATASAIGADRVGVRISPYGVFNGTESDAKTDEVYLAFVSELQALGVAYLHVIDHSAMGAPPVKPEIKAAIRAKFKGSYILSGGYDAARAEADLAEGKGDLVAFGRPFIANPNLTTKLKSGGAFAEADAATFYTPGEKGYSDYAG
jgi:N-ethylmaleimide reductase